MFPMSDVFSLQPTGYMTVYDYEGNSDKMPTAPLEVVDVPLAKPVLVLDGFEKNLQPIVTKVMEQLKLGEILSKISLFAVGGFHHVLAFETASDEVIIARIGRVSRSQDQFVTMLKGESAVISLLPASVPIPRVLHVEHVAVALGLPWMLMERAEGVELQMVYGGLSFEQKLKMTRNVAKVMAEVFSVTNASCGSVQDVDTLGQPIPGPVRTANAEEWAPIIGPGQPSTNDIASKHMDLLRERSGPEAKTALHALDRARQAACSSTPPATYHLTHLDIRMANVFVAEKPDVPVSALLDWDLHAFLPPPLAADYPHWLRYDGYYDPKYNPRGTLICLWWEERPDATHKLRAAFAEAVRESHPEFFSALQEGALGRQLFSWLDNWEDCEDYYSGVLKWAASVMEMHGD